jgi:TatD DNase family protein
MLIDTHAHLFYPNFEDDINQIIDNAASNGVDAVIVPATDLKNCEETLKLCDRFSMIYGAVGVHPQDSKEWNNSWVKEIESFSKHPKVVAIGEIGLDYYHYYSPKQTQAEAFRSQIELALSLNKPIVVHNRESDSDMMDIISSYKNSRLRAQFHCFNGSIKDAKEFIKMGHYISFVGNVTFKKADSLREVLLNVDLNRLFIETDSPFMTPVPFRGKRNEPAFVKYVADKVAEVHNKSFDEIAEITSRNAKQFFGITL